MHLATRFAGTSELRTSRPATASPNPPTIEWFSAVTTRRPDLRASARIVCSASSDGWYVQHSYIDAVLLQLSGCFQRRMVIRRMEMISTSLPAPRVLALPISNL
jgi:hypothetical protein